MEKHETEHNVRLTAAEMATLWTQYISETMATCIFIHFLKKVEDTEIRSVIEYASSVSLKHMQTISDIFKHEKYPIPIGFTNNDVNVEAPRLFSDSFFLMYLKNMATLGMASSSVAVAMVTRSDVSDFFMECVASATELHNKARKVLLSKGIYVRPPFISVPERVDFVKKQNFLTGFFGQRRPLHAIEITHLFSNVQTNSIGKVMMLGFAQVAKDSEVKNYMVRGKQIANKHMEIFSSILVEEDLPAPMSWDSHVLDSTVSPFSDKLMMFLTAALTAAGIGNYGAATSASARRDLGVHYARLAQEIAAFAEDGTNIMIDRGWMEEPPQADNRKELIKV